MKIKVRRISSVLFAFFFSCLTVYGQLQTFYPKREFRGAWIQAVNGQFRGMGTEQMKQNLIDQLNALEEAGINAIIFQVRPEADALYQSNIEPWSRYLTGVQGKAPSPFWDPMEFMIEECHKRGMEFHAWINPYRTKTSMANDLAPSHIYNRHPEWFLKYGNQLFFDPALQESRDYIALVVGDIVTRYDVDAIHMDDYFYPYPIQGLDFPDDGSYARLGGKFNDRGDWRRHNVNLLIEQIHKTIRKLKPWVKFGVSPFGVYRNQLNDPHGSDTRALQNYDDLYADVLLWVNKGWVDYNIPQVYWHVGHPAADYAKVVDWWAKHAGNRPLFIGHSVMNTVQNTDPRNKNINQLPLKMAIQRGYQTILGSCQWPASTVVENVANYKDALVTTYHKHPALMPLFPFIDDKSPRKVRRVKANWTSEGYVLSWKSPRGKKEMDKAVQYVVYCFDDKETIDIENPEKIVGITTETSFLLPYNDGETRYQYVVTALDRLQNESKSKRIRVKL